MIGYLLDVGSQYLKGTMSINGLIVEPLSYFAHYGCVNGNAPLWFLTNLFCARFIYNLFQRKILVALLALVMAIALHYIGWNYPLNLGGLMVGLFFYALGDLLRSRQYGIWQLIVSVLLFALSIMIGIQRVSIFRNSLEQGEYYVLFFIQSTAAIIMVNNLVNRLQLRETNIFCLISRYSIGFYVSHWPILLIILSLLKQMGEFSQSQTILLIVVLLVMILPIVNSTIKRLKLI